MVLALAKDHLSSAFLRSYLTCKASMDNLKSTVASLRLLADWVISTKSQFKNSSRPRRRWHCGRHSLNPYIEVILSDEILDMLDDVFVVRL